MTKWWVGKLSVFPEPPDGHDRPHGWFAHMGGQRYGPIPKREHDKKTWGEQNTWPPRTLEEREAPRTPTYESIMTQQPHDISRRQK